MNELEAFRIKEIKNLKKLRFISYTALIIINLVIIFLFINSSYSVYVERNINENFLTYAAQTILGLQCILFLVLGSIGIIIYRRFQFTIKEINNLNQEYLQRYREYVNSIERAFTGIPPYLFTQRGIIIKGNFSHDIYPANKIDKLKITIVKRGGLDRNIVTFYQNNKAKSTLTFIGFQTRQLEFIKINVKKENPNVIIEFATKR